MGPPAHRFGDGTADREADLIPSRPGKDLGGDVVRGRGGAVRKTG